VKKTEREIYIEIASIIDWNLCGFCRHSRNNGDSVCGESECWCEHPLEAVTDMWNYDGGIAPPSNDCWGFAPVLSVRNTADIVGVILAEGYDTERCQWWKENGELHVEGIKANK